MRLALLLASGTVAIAVVVLIRSRLPTVYEPPSRPLSRSEVAPVCPWREPQRDLDALFPPATNYTLETRIVSSLMAPIQKRLGRTMTVDENPLRIFRVEREGRSQGSVLLTRVKGEHGGIEIVIGVDVRATVQGILIQSQREPEPVAQLITSSNFLASFAGKDSAALLRVGEDLPDVPGDARVSAQAIADGVRSQLIVLSFAEKSLEARPLEAHTHR